MKFRRLLVTFAALVGVLGLAGTASAQTAEDASGAGLSAEQADYVQDKIDQIVAADPDFEQVSANTVEVDGVSIAIGAPGQQTVASMADYTCHYKNLCTWHNNQFDEWFYCGRIWLTNWTGDGWAINNQTPGTTSHFYNQDGSRRFSIPAGYYRNFNWDPIWSFQVC